MSRASDGGPPPAPDRGADWVERLEGHITRRAGGQIRDLSVRVSDDRLVLRGRSRTYHAKQVAQEAAMDLTGDGFALTNEIEVC